MRGMNMIRTLRIHLTNYEHVVYEKNPEIGGTWFENRYPGCKCDIPSHNYQFSWRPNPEWSEFFSPASEIQDYLCRVCDEEKMRDVIKTEHQVTGGIWDATEVCFARPRSLLEYEEGDMMLTLTSHWKWPEIPGLHSFEGGLVHSANWPENFDYAGKTVALVGNGSSGVQILPETQQRKFPSLPPCYTSSLSWGIDIKNLVHLVRDPTLIVPSRLQLLAQGHSDGMINGLEMNADGTFPPAQIAKFKADLNFYRLFVKTVEEAVNGNFPVNVLTLE